MSIEEIRAVAQIMQDFGLSHVKTDSLELSRDCSTPPAAKALPIIPPDAPVATTEDPIKHKIEELTSLMKMDDMDLVDQLFPEPVEEQVEVAS